MTNTLSTRIEARMKAMGLNRSATAAKAGLKEDFIRDIVRGTSKDPGAHKLAKVAEALETTVYDLLGIQEPRASIDVRHTRNDVQELPVIGRVSASHWWDVDEDTERGDLGTVPSVSSWPIEWQFGMIVEGNCLNRIANHGDRLVCLDVIKASYQPSDNDLVVIERTRYGGQMMQRTAKRLRRVNGVFQLWPESDDPAHQDPLLLDAQEEDEVRVLAKVLFILKTP